MCESPFDGTLGSRPADGWPPAEGMRCHRDWNMRVAAVFLAAAAASADEAWLNCAQEKKPCKVGEELFYCGSMRYTSVGAALGPMMGGISFEPPLISGSKGTAVGKNSSETLAVQFTVLMGKVVDIELPALSRTKPPPPFSKEQVIMGCVGLVLFFVLCFVGLYYYMKHEDRVMAATNIQTIARGRKVRKTGIQFRS